MLRAVAQGDGKGQLEQHNGEIPGVHTLPAAAPGMEVSTAVLLHLPTWKAQQLRAAWGGRSTTSTGATASTGQAEPGSLLSWMSPH